MTCDSDNPVKIIDARLLLSLIPHRHPFVMIDRVIDVDGDVSGVGIKNVSMTEPCFVGHFPDNPVFPGVFIIEAMAQTACAICALHASGADGSSPKPIGVYFTTLDKVKFRKPVVPGDTLRLHVKKTRQKANMRWFQCNAEVDGKPVAEGVISAMIIQ